MKRLVTITFIMMLLGSGCSFETQDSRFGRLGTIFATKGEPGEPEPFVSTLSDSTDIHYSAQYCTECHEKTPSPGGPKFLRYRGDFKGLCRCHYNAEQNYIHPVDLIPSGELKPRIPPDLPLQEGKITCATCHDIFVQCTDKPYERIFLSEHKFLRGAPYQNRTTLCFKCHDITKYKKYNPHRQLDKSKQIVTATCLYCHSEVPDEKRATEQDIKLLANPELICVGCHARLTVHPWHIKHLVKPPFEIAKRIEELKNQYQIILPLDDDGKITCATCHNPHEKGVIPDRRLGAKGAGEKFRHRIQDNMCVKCHPMQDLSKYPELLL